MKKVPPWKSLCNDCPLVSEDFVEREHFFLLGFAPDSLLDAWIEVVVPSDSEPQIPLSTLFSWAWESPKLIAQLSSHIGPVLVTVSAHQFLDSLIFFFSPHTSGAHFMLFNQYNKYETQSGNSINLKLWGQNSVESFQCYKKKWWYLLCSFKEDYNWKYMRNHSKKHK